MGVAVALGEPGRTDGFALAGAVVVHAEDRPSIAEACAALPADVAVVVLTATAAASGAAALLPDGVLSVVMPDGPVHP